ncbi:MAG: SMP-30/gluconolactonase/LRE family protein [Acidobacteria bacterium]|nr:SMP-30/gluconolactonase/LRE family protein [Acidobacteriota bacterium]
MDSTGSTIYALTGTNVYKITSRGVVSNYVGNGRAAFGGDGGQATTASIDATAIALDERGQLFIADFYNSRVRKVAADGTISTIAGNGTFAFAGDGGPAVQARLYGPDGVAVDRTGNVFVSDSYNHRIRKISPDGVITTIAGNGGAGSTGNGNPATSAAILYPSHLVLDSNGNLYFAGYDTRIRKVTAAGIMQAFAGSGSYGFAGDGGPAVQAAFGDYYSNIGVAVDGQNNVYVMDVDNDRIRKVDASGVINTVAGASHFRGENAAGSSALMKFPTGIMADRGGTVYFTDTENMRIRAISPQGIVTTFLGNGLPVSTDGPLAGARTFFPSGLTQDGGGNFYFGEGARVRRISAAGVVSTVAGTGTSGFSGDGSPGNVARVSRPYNVVVDANNNVYFADTGNHRVRKIAADGTITTVAGNGTAGFAGDGGPATQARLSNPRGVALDRNGNLYIADSSNQRIRRVDGNGTISTVAGNGSCCSSGDNGPATGARLGTPYAVAFDATGNLYIADWLGNQIRRVGTNGVIMTVAGTGEPDFSGDGGSALVAAMNGPSSMFIDAAGAIYFCDQYNHRIRKLTPLVPSVLSIASGDQQSAPVGTVVPKPLVVKVTSTNGAGVPGVQVTFTITGGSGTLSTSNVVTGVDGTAAVTLTLGTTVGDVTVRAVASGLQQVTFTISAANASADAKPVIDEGGVVSGGLSTPPLRTIAPGSRVVIQGSGFAAAEVNITRTADDPLTENLQGTCVRIGGQRALIYLLTPTRIGAVAPDAGTGDHAVQVSTGCDTANELASNEVTVAMQQYSPEFFYAGPEQGGKRPVLMTNNEGVAKAAALAGDTVNLSMTGLSTLAEAPVVTLGQNPLPAESVTATPGFAGAYAVQIKIPDDQAAGDIAISVTIGGVSTAEGVVLPVKLPARSAE